MIHSYSCFLPFHLADPAGILFFGHPFSLAHQAFEDFVLSKWAESWSFWFQNPEWILPIRQAEAEYLHPLQAGQTCQIELSLPSLSLSSFTLLAHFMQQQKLCCLVKTVHLFCDRSTKNKRPIPSAILSKLKNFL